MTARPHLLSARTPCGYRNWRPIWFVVRVAAIVAPQSTVDTILQEAAKANPSIPRNPVVASTSIFSVLLFQLATAKFRN
jgi:hypothetical protein